MIMEITKINLGKKEYVDFQKYSEINVLRTLVAFCNTNGGIIRIRDNKKEIDEDFIYSMLRDNRGRLPHWLISFGYNEDINLLSNSLYFKSITIDNESFFTIEVDTCKFKNGYLYLTNNDGGKEYYFRVKGKNVKTDEKTASYWEKIALFDSPIYNDYQPDEEGIKKELEKARDRVVVKSIGELTRNTYIYKYLDLESALQSLENNNLRFVEPTNWDDQYEGRFYNAKFKNPMMSYHSSSLTPFLYATCLSTKQESEAAWVLYSHNKKGLASRCVEFKLNRKKLFDQIVKHVLDSLSNGDSYSLYIGRVEYLSKFVIDNLHRKHVGKSKNINKNYLQYFDKFTLESYLNLLLLKRLSFQHEEELRIFIVPKSGKIKTRRTKSGKYSQNGKTGKSIKPQDTFVKIDWGTIIEEIRIDKNCTNYEKKLLKDRLNAINPAIIIDEDYDPYEDKSLKSGPLTIVTK